ncbi:transcriptional regulator, LysR family [Desulfitobacterium hafniense DCB-2]|uniref:Transcriptional regulator, LysR family n=1 Tax=Desulfitobacterium hafniense (strain DSM 10664 / DCB-2) TaxID=272564 RepID=B8FUZ2_DESHD|nr:LysR family transcriptional regulator [Desulfitobacterium hafniense]ACL18638.1 transcriptional regulator, LysR family [Desulfitobacterium hafniense DCB-2]
MEIKQIYYFTEVSKYGSFAQAAKMLFVTPQALSKSINNLEKEYNCQLFIRKNNNLILSDIGRGLLPQAKALLEDYYAFDQRIKQLSEIENGYFRVAIVPDSLSILDINLFKKFRELYPQLNPDYLELPDRVVEEYLEAGLVETCFHINTLPNQEEYESVLLCSSELCAITRGGNNCLDRKDYVTLKDLADKKIVTKGESYKSFALLAKAAQAENITLNYEVKTADTSLALDMIASPGYVGTGPYAMYGVLEHTGDTAVPFSPSLPWNIYLSYKKYKPVSKPVQLFIKYVKEHYSISD